jgi:hypothetical protein
LAEPCLKMGKKSGEGASAEGSTNLELEALKARLESMEGFIQVQSKELKAEVLSSQQAMKLEIKDQMDKFFVMLMKVHISTPPPQPAPLESMASNVAHVIDQTPQLGENSVSMPMFKLSVSPQSHVAHPRATTLASHKPILPQRPQLPPQTPPINQTLKN